jgi:hypothetical protein
LLGGLLGAGPFVPRAFATDTAPAAYATFDIPGLAAGLGVALAAAALAGIALSRRRPTVTRPEAEQTAAEESRDIDPLLAALRGAAAYAPDDLDPRLGAHTSVGSPASAGSGPRWVRRIDPTRPETGPTEPGDLSDTWHAVADHDLARL